MLFFALAIILAPMATRSDLSSDDQTPGRAVDGRLLQDKAADARVDTVAHLLDLGVRLGDPFPSKDAMPSMPVAANAAKARSIVKLAAVAQDRGLNRSADFLRAAEAMRQMLLAEKLMQSLSDSIVIEQREVRNIFDRFPDKYDEFDLSHIFFDAGEEPGSGSVRDKTALSRATAAQTKLRNGEAFSKVAELLSDDKESAREGGSLPVILGANIRSVFFGVVKDMEPGSVSKIVKGDRGYHIIKLVSRRHEFAGPAQDLIEQEIRNREMRKLLPVVSELEEMAK